MWCVRGGRGEGASKDVEGSLGHVTYKVYPMMNLIIQYGQHGLVFVFVLGLICMQYIRTQKLIMLVVRQTHVVLLSKNV